MADTIEKVETNIEGRDRDDIGNSKEENQFNSVLACTRKLTLAGSTPASGSTRKTA